MKKIIHFTMICLVASILFASPNAFAKKGSKKDFSEIEAPRITAGPVEPVQAHSVPEPSTMFLVGSGLFAFGLVSRKRMIR